MPEPHRSCIVVPAYNEETRLDVATFQEYLGRETPVDFIFVNDGSTDGTLALLRRVAASAPERVQVLNLSRNGGKAEAVRQGMKAALARPGLAYAGYWDADWATPLSDIDVFVRCLSERSEVQLVLGARVALLGRKIGRKPLRHYAGRVAATVASLVLWLPVYDTQCGAKLFRPSETAKALFEKPFITKWVFDVEMLARFRNLEPGAKNALYELPLDHWEDVGESKVRPLDFLRAFGDMARIYREYRLPSRYRGLFNLVTSRFVRYTIAGSLGTVMHYLALAVSVEAFGLEAAIGSTIGAVIGALVNYVLNYHFTFTATGSHKTTLPKFLTVALLGVFINGGVVDFGVNQLGLHYMLAQIAATATVLLVGYLLNRVWTFRRGREQPVQVLEDDRSD